jgi:ABC-type dipeptide/oligopeptide/nickel transport system permease component
MLEVIREDYIRTARAKGLASNVILVRHALRNALLPVMTGFGAAISRIITGSVVVETIFHIPGMGRSIVDAIGSRDYPVIQGLVLLFVAVILVVNLVVDLLYSVVDPRIRYN